MRRRFSSRRSQITAGARWSACFVIAGLFGCKIPNKSNIALRKQVKELHGQLDSADRTHQSDQATIDSLKMGATTVPSFSEARLDQLYTVHGLSFKRLTLLHSDRVEVHVVPTDDDGQPIKAAGSLRISALDPDRVDGPPVATWSFSTTEARRTWLGSALQYEYALNCPLPVDQHPQKVLLRVAFRDELTGRSFSADKLISAFKE